MTNQKLVSNENDVVKVRFDNDSYYMTHVIGNLSASFR